MFKLFNEHNFVLIKEEEMHRDKFLNKAKVTKGSYAEEVLGRIYDSLTLNNIDVREDYEKFYVKEYNDFANFLQRKYALPSNIVNDVIFNLLPSKRLYYGHVYNLGDYSIGQLIQSEEMVKIINEIM